MFDVLKCASASIPALTAPNLHFVRNYNPFKFNRCPLLTMIFILFS